MKTQQLRFTSNVMLTAVLIGLIAPPSVAQRQLWIRQFGTFESDGARALAPDGAGGVMVAGYTVGNLGGLSAGWQDVFLARYDGAGTQLWVRQFGSSANDRAHALAADGAGGVIVAGYTDGDLSGSSAGGQDVFLARYDGAGTQLWIRQFGSSDDDVAYALAPDGAGGVMVAGETWGSLGGPFLGGVRYGDAWLARYDDMGNRLWIRQFGTSNTDVVTALAPDGTGGVMVAGLKDALAGSYESGGVFLARYDGGGNQLWIRKFSTNTNDMPWALAPDGAGGVMVAGDTRGNLAGPSAGGYDAFLARYDGAGNRLWIRQFGTTFYDTARALAPYAGGDVLVAGYTNGSLGGPSPRLGYGDVFLARYDGAGNRLWISQFSSTNSDIAYALAPDDAGGMMVAGLTWGSFSRPNIGQTDAFLARFAESCYADCDQSTGVGVLDIFDFLCWQNDFVTGNSYACDCDTSTGPLVCDMLDFLCFQNSFLAGCP